MTTELPVPDEVLYKQLFDAEYWQLVKGINQQRLIDSLKRELKTRGLPA